MKVRFQADNDLDRTIVRGVLRRCPLVDFRSQPVNDVDDLTVLHGRSRWPDPGIARHQHDAGGFFAQYRQGGHSPGVLLVPQLWPLAETIGQLVIIWELSKADEWQDRICYLPTLLDFRTRG